MTEKYRKFKLVQEMTPEEIKTAKETEFDFDENALGAFIPIDQIQYEKVPDNCKPDTFPVSYRNGDYRADAVCDGFVAPNGDIYISEHEMDIGICIEWEVRR